MIYPMTLEQFWVMRGEGGDYIVGSGDHEMTDELPQDIAHLIAAAPELFKALRDLVEVVTPGQDPLIMFAAIERARTALEKAEGQP